MASPVRSLAAFSASLLFLCALVTSTATRAHPPHNPFLNPDGEDSRFAPVTEFGPKISIELVARGMTAPLKGVAAPGLPDHLFVVDQPGTLWIVDLKNPNPDTNKRVYLDLTARIVLLGVCGVGTFDERGLLGVAFAPDFQKTGRFYTYTSERKEGRTTVPLPTPGTDMGNADHHNVVAEFRANPANLTAEVSTATRREILHANWPQFNHDGGDLAFGPDGKLYISMGDGGGADDADGQPFVTAPPYYPVCGEKDIFGHQGRDGNGQRVNTALGKILRIDVNPPFSLGKQYRVPGDNPFVGKIDPSTKDPAVPEIWAYGFRNPFRFSFDSNTGELYVGDVGQNDIEEVDIVKKGGNFGWSCKEGTAFFHVNGSEPDDGFASTEEDSTRPLCLARLDHFIDPTAQYDTHREGHSVIGGFVYHGKRVPALRGKYVFADFSLLFKFPRGPHDYGRLFTFNARGDEGRGHHDRLRQISELMVVPGGAVSLAVLGMGQDARGEIYVTGNISGLPFADPDDAGNRTVFNGRVIRIVVAEDERKGGHHHGGHGGDDQLK